MIEWAAVGVLAGLAVAGTTVLSFWLAFSERISRAQAKAEQAERDADAARKYAAEVNSSLVAMSAAFAMYREQIAREYIHRESMMQVEERLTNQISDLGKRIDRYMLGRPVEE